MQNLKYSTVLLMVLTLLAAVACMDTGLTIETEDPDQVGAEDSATMTGDNMPETAAKREDTPAAPDELAATPDNAATDTEPEVVAGPACHEALTCLVDMKNWQPGMPLSSDECMAGINDLEMQQADDLLNCVDEKCVDEFDAWDNGGQVELAMLYLCMIDNCPQENTVCIGGHGEDDCGDAVMCLTACPDPMDTGCTVPCLESTTEEHSVKAGKFLKCVMDACGGMEELPACDIPLSCGLKCPELAS